MLGCCGAPDPSPSSPSPPPSPLPPPSSPAPPPSPSPSPAPPPAPPAPPGPPKSPGLSLLGGDPLGSSSLQWPKADPHPQQPTDLWPDTNAPLPTNAWWENLVLEDGGNVGENVVYPMPYLARALPDGLHVSLPRSDDKVKSVDFVILPVADVVSLGAHEDPSGRKIFKHDMLSVTVRWSAGSGHFDVPLVRGSPYATALYTRVTPELKFASGGVLKVDGTAPGEGSARSVKGERFALELGNGESWTLYASPAIALRVKYDSIVAEAEYTGTLRVALTPAGAGKLLDAHAGRVPVGGEVHARASGDVAAVDFEWKAHGPGTLLTMALPHQMDVLAADTVVANLTYGAMKGRLTAVVGDTWSMSEPLPQVDWGAPRRIAPHRLAAVRAAVRADVAKPVEAIDPYGGGKELAALGRLALIADEVGEDKVAATVRQRLGGLLEAWFEGTGPDPLRYEPTWGGVVSKNGLADRNADFGGGWFNDHHFHYGYFIYASAAVAKGNASWLAKWDGAVRHLVRDIANPSADDPLYTRSRYKDWYEGHGWANGLFPSASSRNQESVSEATNAWYGVALYGVASADARLRDLGRLMLATELRAAHHYWQIIGTDVYPKVFADNGVVGCLWSTKVDRSTWFGDAPEYTFGIQIMPLTPVTELLLRPVWLRAARPAWSAAEKHATDAWRAFLIGASAVLDPDDAWSDADALKAFDNGNSKTNMLYWVGTRDHGQGPDPATQTLLSPPAARFPEPPPRAASPHDHAAPSAAASPKGSGAATSLFGWLLPALLCVGVLAPLLHPSARAAVLAKARAVHAAAFGKPTAATMAEETPYRPL